MTAQQEHRNTTIDTPFNKGAIGLSILFIGCVIAILGLFKPLTNYIYLQYHIEPVGWMILGGSTMFFVGCILVLLYGVNLK